MENQFLIDSEYLSALRPWRRSIGLENDPTSRTDHMAYHARHGANLLPKFANKVMEQVGVL